MRSITKKFISFQILIIILAFSFTVYKTVFVGDFEIVNYFSSEDDSISEDNLEIE